MEKIKPKITNWIGSEKGKDILIVLVVILVGLGSFELGRLSKQNSSSGIKIEYPNKDPGQTETQTANAVSVVNNIPKTTSTANTIKTFFASNRGTKYYSIGCSGGKTIKQENRVYFATREEAERAGYTLSSSCR